MPLVATLSAAACLERDMARWQRCSRRCESRLTAIRRVYSIRGGAGVFGRRRCDRMVAKLHGQAKYWHECESLAMRYFVSGEALAVALAVN